jgi:PPK2 family polyphosphate:nucleotide phosphotransferase
VSDPIAAPRLHGMRVDPDEPAHLARRDPGDDLGLHHAKAEEDLARLVPELDALHDRLWAEATRAVLLVLQGVDTAGKDGAIRKVLTGLNPQGCTVAGFKAPVGNELAHDYLWRVHAVCPPRGRLGVFNRSHYEDVVAARMLGVVDDEQCRRRYRHIRDFERLLTDEGTTVVKVYLHISEEEQRKRLQARLDDPAKRWKFRKEDLDVRAQWNGYQHAYEDALTATSTEHAPWYVVPADSKRVRDVALAQLLVQVLRKLDPQLPPPDRSLDGLVVE